MNEFYYKFKIDNMIIKIPNIQYALRECALRLYNSCLDEELLYKAIVEKSIDTVLLASYMDYVRYSLALNLKRNTDLITNITSEKDLYDYIENNPYFIRTIFEASMMLGDIDLIDRARVLSVKTPIWLTAANKFNMIEQLIYKTEPVLNDTIEDIINLDMQYENSEEFNTDKILAESFMKLYTESRLNIVEMLLEELLVLRFTNEKKFLILFKEILESSLLMSYYQIKTKKFDDNHQSLWQEFQRKDINNLILMYADNKDFIFLISIIEMWLDYSTEKNKDLIDIEINEEEKFYIRKKLYKGGRNE